MSKVGEKFIFEVEKTGLGKDCSNKLVCGEKVVFVPEEEMASMTKGPEWISSAIELPKKECMYLAVFDDGFVTSVEWFEEEWQLWDESGEVVAWMHLPEAPEPKSLNVDEVESLRETVKNSHWGKE